MLVADLKQITIWRKSQLVAINSADYQFLTKSNYRMAPLIPIDN
jgi:hypothetical protein